MFMRRMRRDTEAWSNILIIYDIEHDKTRAKVVRILESYGIRVQKSAFECHLDDSRIVEMKNRLKKVVTEGDSIRIYQVNDSYFDVSRFENASVYTSRIVVV